MRPSGRKATRQGNSKVAVVNILKGCVASGFCSPTLTWAQAATDARVNNTAFANFISILPRFQNTHGVSYTYSRISLRHRNGHGLPGAAFGDPDGVASRLHCSGSLEAFLDDRDAGLVAIDRNH